MSFKSYGTWVGLDVDGRVQAACIVTSPKREDEAREFVAPGSWRLLRVGPDVTVRFGYPLPAPEGNSKPAKQTEERA